MPFLLLSHFRGRVDFGEKIERFEQQYRMLGMSVTPKAHLLFVHAIDFLEMKGFVAGLGAYSEQAMEAAHHEFKLEWELTKVNQNHKDYDELLHKAILRFNGKRI